MANREEWGDVEGLTRRIARWDTDTGTYSRYDAAGEVIESRPLTEAEIAGLTPATDTRGETIAQVEAMLAGAPLLLDEMTDALTNLVAVLKGGG